LDFHSLQQRLKTIEEPLYILNCHAFLVPFFWEINHIRTQNNDVTISEA
jgi:hypothetical protein